MFDTPVDTWYRWLGVASASLAVLGAAAGLPTGAGPDAAAAAATVDGVAACTHPGVAEHPLSADRVRLGPETVALDSRGHAATATLSYGPVTPVRDGTRLAVVLAGTPPSRVFDSPAAFERAAAGARRRRPAWRRAGDRILVRRVSWEGVDVVLVGA
jgi:hypothetical protein